MQTSLVSAVAAVPAALLTLASLMVFLRYSESLTLVTGILVGVTAALAVCVALTPFALLIPPRKKAEPATQDTEPSETVVFENEEAKVDMDEVEVTDADDTEVAETVDFDSGQLKAEIDEFDAANAPVELDEDTEEISDSAVFLDEEEEEPPPKKRR